MRKATGFYGPIYYRKLIFLYFFIFFYFFYFFFSFFFLFLLFFYFFFLFFYFFSNFFFKGSGQGSPRGVMEKPKRDIT